jgi:FkbM family methyltransferase
MNKQKLLFDIGFNHGRFTLDFFKNYSNSKSIGVDGNPFWIEHFNRNPLQNTEILNYIISDKNNEKIEFFMCDENRDINSINPEWIERIRHKHFYDRSKKSIFVNSITLDHMISLYGKPDLIKLDIEGSESLALKGLSQKVDLIIFEWSEDYFEDTIKCIDILKNLGFTKFGNSEQTDYLQNVDFKTWEDLGIFLDIDPKRKVRWGTMYAK